VIVEVRLIQTSSCAREARPRHPSGARRQPPLTQPGSRQVIRRCTGARRTMSDLDAWSRPKSDTADQSDQRTGDGADPCSPQRSVLRGTVCQGRRQQVRGGGAVRRREPRCGRHQICRALSIPCRPRGVRRGSVAAVRSLFKHAAGPVRQRDQRIHLAARGSRCLLPRAHAAVDERRCGERHAPSLRRLAVEQAILWCRASIRWVRATADMEGATSSRY
jgi:hypothetical protein